jgi:hypothetical protein
VTKFFGGHTRRKTTFDETLLHLGDDHSKNLDNSGDHTFALPFRFRLNKLSFITCFRWVDFSIHAHSFSSFFYWGCSCNPERKQQWEYQGFKVYRFRGVDYCISLFLKDH